VRLREYRQQLNLTREDLARELRRTGLLWTRSTIEELESGSRGDISVTELLQLAIAFQLPPEKFLEASDERWLQGHGESSITVEGARQTLRGDVPSASSAIDPGTAAADDFWTYEDRGRLASRAERRAAQRLRVSSEEVMDAARHRWHHGLDEERDARLGEGEQGRGWRGQVTRRLMDELRDEVEKLRKLAAAKRYRPLPVRKTVPRRPAGGPLNPGSASQPTTDENGGGQ
jgi:transcriptional regulator with XRE-family HTH domain